MSTTKLNEGELLKMGFTRANIAALREVIDAIGNIPDGSTAADLFVAVASLPIQQLQSELSRCRSEVDALTMELRSLRISSDAARARCDALENTILNQRQEPLQPIHNRLNHLESAVLIERL